VRQADGRVRTVPLSAADGFTPDVSAFADALGPDTAAMLLNSPTNPTGAVIPGDDLEALVRHAERTDTVVVSDEVYHGLAYDEAEQTVLEYTDDAFVLDGASKRYAMTGWRLGWMIVPPAYADAVNRLAQNALVCAPNFVQDTGVAALRSGDDWRADVRDWGFDLGYTPQGAYYLLANASGLPGDVLA
jgi:aspartate/methionine/tyrosine aminotransferase